LLEFESLGHIIQRVSAHENCYQDSRGGRYQKKVAHISSKESESEEEVEVGLAEWMRNNKPVSSRGLRPVQRGTTST
jgi:hypothetical protein